MPFPIWKVFVKKIINSLSFLLQALIAKKINICHLIQMMISPSQCRAARGLLDWTQTDLASHTGLSRPTVRAFEAGAETREATGKVIRLAMESAGVLFIDQNGAGAGVRLRDKTPPAAGKPEA